tara:strand:- start:33757 stop:34071 length:315 start_codon:yes stop_codon:yes gene_type:complete
MDRGIGVNRYCDNLDIELTLDRDLNSNSITESKAKRRGRGKAKAGKTKNELAVKQGSSIFLDKAWKVGYKAAQENVSESRNPFFMGTGEYELWIEGWWAGFYEK